MDALLRKAFRLKMAPEAIVPGICINKLYLITTDQLQPVKIGAARDVKTRLNGIQSSNWIKLQLHKTFHCPLGKTYEIERYVHTLLSHTTIRGEWFDLQAGIAELVVLDVLEMYKNITSL